MMILAIVSSVYLDIIVMVVEMLFLMDFVFRDIIVSGVRILLFLLVIIVFKVIIV